MNSSHRRPQPGAGCGGGKRAYHTPSAIGMGSAPPSSRSPTWQSASEALAAAIAADRPADARAYASDLIVCYVAIVAMLWRKVGLHPTRATRRCCICNETIAFSLHSAICF
jgi:hypothetical protein